MFHHECSTEPTDRLSLGRFADAIHLQVHESGTHTGVVLTPALALRVAAAMVDTLAEGIEPGDAVEVGARLTLSVADDDGDGDTLTPRVCVALYREVYSACTSVALTEDTVHAVAGQLREMAAEAAPFTATGVEPAPFWRRVVAHLRGLVAR